MKATNHFLPDFGRMLKYHRLLQGFTLDDIALPCGLNKVQVSKMERGLYSPPPLPVLKQMAKMLKISERSTDFTRFVNLAMESRLEGPKGGPAGDKKAKKQTVRVYFPSATPSPDQQVHYDRIRENPWRPRKLEEAAQAALRQIDREGAKYVSARLLVRASNCREWEYEVILPSHKRKET